MGWGSSPVASLAAGLGSNGGTSGAIDSTGGNTIMLLVGTATGGTPSVSDIKSNTWTLVDSTTDGSGHWGRLYIAKNAACGTGHTFTVTLSGGVVGIAVVVFAGGDASAPTDLDHVASNNFQSTINAGSITPSGDNELVLACVANSDVQSLSTIGESYTIGPNLAGSSGANFGAAIAYKIQGTATATNPTFTMTGSTLSNHAILAAFKPGAAAAAAYPVGTIGQRQRWSMTQRRGRLFHPAWPATAPIPLQPGRIIHENVRAPYLRQRSRPLVVPPPPPVTPPPTPIALPEHVRRILPSPRGRQWQAWGGGIPIPLEPGQIIRIPARLLNYRRVGRLWFPVQPTPPIPSNLFPNARQPLRHPIWQRRGRIWNPAWPVTPPIPLQPGQTIRVRAVLLHYRRVGRLWMPVQPTPPPVTYPAPVFRMSLRQPPYRRVGRLWVAPLPAPQPQSTGYPFTVHTSLRQPPYRRVGRLWVPIQPFVAPPVVQGPVFLIIGGRVAVPVSKGVFEWI